MRMPIMDLFNDPVSFLRNLLIGLPAILLALVLHECAHGYVAYKCGDPTAKMMGRLSFNPLKHLDPIGTLFMLLFGFGWARPVPVNPRNYKHFRRDDLLVSIAGITMNFCLFFVTMLLLTGINQLLWKPELWTLGSLATPKEFLSFQGMNFYSVLGGENYVIVENAAQYVRGVEGSSIYLSPLTPAQLRSMSIVFDSTGAYYFAVDGLADYLRTPWLIYVQRFLMFFARINLSLAVFNLIPIPPLDGYHVVNDIFLRGRLHIPAKVINLLMIGMLALFYFTNVFSTAISTAVSFIQGGVLNAILWIFGLGG